MALTKEKREQLSDNDFAVPETKQLPINDSDHVKMAWDQVDNTKGLSDEQRSKARERILNKAKELGLDTEKWQKLKGMRFEAMAIEMPDVKDHPNKVPFSGILTRVDQPSDNPLGGSHGKRVILPKAVADKALPTLLGMCVDFTPLLDGHNPQQKIGLITDANIIGDAIHISGFFYAADFPTEVKTIQANKASLGFSYEAQSHVRSLSEDPLVIDNCDFTGAAVLFKDKAAYMTTSLQAKAEINMSEEILSAIKELKAEMQLLKDENAKLRMHAGNSVQDLVAPHAAKLRACADGMEAAGIGLHGSRGHVAIANGLADHLEAAAAVGQVPHTYQGTDFLHAGTEKDEEKEDKKEEEQESKEMTALKAQFEEIKSKLVDFEKSKIEQSASPDRKTLPPSVMRVLDKHGLTASAGKFTIASLDEMAKKGNLSRVQSIALKENLKQANMIEGV